MDSRSEKLLRFYVALVDTHAIETYENWHTCGAQWPHRCGVRVIIDMAYPLAWTSSRRSLEVLERALRSARTGNPFHGPGRAPTFCLRSLARKNCQDAEESRNAFAEILKRDDRHILAPYLADYGFIKLDLIQNRQAHRSLIESRVILLRQ